MEHKIWLSLKLSVAIFVSDAGDKIWRESLTKFPSVLTLRPTRLLKVRPNEIIRRSLLDVLPGFLIDLVSYEIRWTRLFLPEGRSFYPATFIPTKEKRGRRHFHYALYSRPVLHCAFTDGIETRALLPRGERERKREREREREREIFKG